MSRTYFKQSVGKTVDSPISTSQGPKPVKPKIKLKTKTGLVEEGDITISGVITRLIKLHKEKSGSKDLQHQTLTERASLGEKHPCVSR
jgi:hypothetical protein